MRMFNRQCVVSGYWLTAERKFHNERMILKICSDGPHCIQTWSSITFNPALPLLFLVISVFYKRQTSKSLSSSSLWHTVYGCWGPSLRSRMHYMLHQWSYSYRHTWVRKKFPAKQTARRDTLKTRKQKWGRSHDVLITMVPEWPWLRNMVLVDLHLLIYGFQKCFVQQLASIFFTVGITSDANCHFLQ